MDDTFFKPKNVYRNCFVLFLEFADKRQKTGNSIPFQLRSFGLFTKIFIDALWVFNFVLSGVIECVDTSKLLGVTVSSDLSWEAHVNTICARVVPRLYCPKQLKHTGLPAADFCIFI